MSRSIDQGYTDYKYYKDFFDSDEKEIIENLRKKNDEDKKTAVVYEAKYKFYKEEIHLPKPFRNINPDFSEDKYNNASIYKYYENEMPFIKNLLVKTQDLDNSKRSRDFWWEVVIVFCNILDFFGYYSYQ